MNRPETSNSLEPLLIFSRGRTGTTLLMQLLGTSPQIIFDRVYPFEVRYLTYLLRWAQMLGQELEDDGPWNATVNAGAPLQLLGPLPHPKAKFWDGQELWPRCFVAAWREFSELVIARADVNGSTESSSLYYAEKVPPWALDLLKKAGMFYRVIMLVRDPRDVFLSIAAFDKKRGFPGFDRRADDDDWTFAKRFIQEYQCRFKILLEEEANPSNVVVTYDRLALNLTNEAQRLSQWLGVKLAPDAIEKQISQFAQHMTSKTVPESIGRWRRELPPELNEFFLRELGVWLRHFGYET